MCCTVCTPTDTTDTWQGPVTAYFQPLGDVSRHTVPETQLAGLAYCLRQQIACSTETSRIRLGQLLTLTGLWADLVLNEMQLQCGELTRSPPITSRESSPSAEREPNEYEVMLYR